MWAWFVAAVYDRRTRRLQFTISAVTDRRYKSGDSCRSLRRHSQDPAIEQEPYGCEGDAADDDGGCFEAPPDQRQRCGDGREDDDRGEHYADDAFADDQARREQHAELLGGLWFWRPVSGAVED